MLESFFEVAEEIKRSTRRGGAQFLIALCVSSDICAPLYTAFLILLRHGCKRIYSKARGKFVEAVLFSPERSQQFAPEEERISPSALLICISSRKMHSRPHREKNWTLFFFFQSGHLNRLGWRGKVTRRILFKRVKTLHTFL